MTEVQGTSESRRKIILSVKNNVIGYILHKTWSSGAEIVVDGKSVCQLRARGFWRRVFEFKHGEKLLLSYRMSWKGRIIITSFLERISKEFFFKRKGIFKNMFVLTDHTGIRILEIEAQFKWVRFKFDFFIRSEKDIFEEPLHNTLVYFLAVHCTRTIMDTAARSAG